MGLYAALRAVRLGSSWLAAWLAAHSSLTHLWQSRCMEGLVRMREGRRGTVQCLRKRTSAHKRKDALQYEFSSIRPQHVTQTRTHTHIHTDTPAADPVHVSVPHTHLKHDDVSLVAQAVRDEQEPHYDDMMQCHVCFELGTQPYVRAYTLVKQMMEAEHHVPVSAHTRTQAPMHSVTPAHL